MVSGNHRIGRLWYGLAAVLIGAPLASGQGKPAGKSSPELLRLSRDEAFRPVEASRQPPVTVLAQDTQAVEAPAEEPLEGWPPGLLMDGLRSVGIGEPMEDLGISFYGYVETSFTGILHGPGGSRAGLPLRVFEARRPDNLRLNQVKLTMERAVDHAKPFDLGGRADVIYGTDSAVIHSSGLLDKERHETQPDLEQGYGQLWFATGKDQGFEITFGKWVTTIGAEVIDAPSNYLVSRSYLFGLAIPFTHTGLMVRYYLDSNNSVYGAVVRGWDNFDDNNDGASWMGGFALSGKELMGDSPRSTVAFNVIAGPEQTGRGHPGNRALADVVWTYLWTEKLTQVLNVDYGFEKKVPGALNSDGVARTRDADWYGVAYMLNYVCNDYVNTTGRLEWFRDHRGVRTGFQGDFFEITTGLAVTPFPHHRWFKELQVRPELRWDFSANNAPFAGDDDQQLTAAVDVIYKF